MIEDKEPEYATFEHDRYVRTVIRTIAAQVQAETGELIPEDVLMVGDDWIYLGKVKGVVYPLFTITPKDKLGLGRPAHISKFIDDFYAQTEKISLIPEGEQRSQEARELGDIVEEQEHSFKVRRGTQEISVYKIRDARWISDDQWRSPTGEKIGLTTFPNHKP